MITKLHNTTTSEVARELVRLREEGGAVALGRVLTLVLVSGENLNEEAIRAANTASGEHPMRVIVLHAYPESGEARIDAEIRIGSDAGASEVVILHARGQAANDPETLVQALLLPDAPVVAWWPGNECSSPFASPIGRIAQLRIVDTHEDPDGLQSVKRLIAGYHDGDTNLAWTRLTRWRAQLAAVLDQPPYEAVLKAEVVSSRVSTGALLMAAWLRHYLDVPVELSLHSDARPGNLRTVRLVRESGIVELERIAFENARLRQTGQPDQIVPLMLRDRYEVLAEELRSLAHDPVYATALLEGVPALDLDSLAELHAAG
ncbi:glucose-6-phosphate dehydrogenase assembly protein OpcA [Gulosibacter sp. 10]|uniref:glucose-6-phosphate dehydrogenase assembly protein OpcA n=1 Tax=Gulosibacter sp. 10 TaxID=1255570 RepID=UPI00097EA7BC|nr:glucose-6-phosphate dehydrogenase assembly protein OpcA [Gulosibacter sp. 10]SJM53330.1 OpcA, an allosteric effector of glucose-6-phosphate dehydrogenase, actinobacterial [Gulosibacter sp. 10]